MPAFDALTTARPLGDGRFAIDIPDGWQQGRGAFGGFVLAILTRASEQVVADPDRPLRSLTAEIVGPAQPGPSEVRVEILRAGTGVTTVAARLVQGGEVQAHVVGAFGKTRPTFRAPVALAPPPELAGPSWRDIAPPPFFGPPMAPTFAQHVEFRVTGPLPFSGAPADGVARTGGWVRLREPGTARDAAYTAAMIDTWWPAMLGTEKAPRAMATLTFALERVSDLHGLDPEAPLFYRGTILAGGGGYAIEQRELWGEDGRLVALNQQTLVIMK